MGSPDAKKRYCRLGRKNGEPIEIPEVKRPIKNHKQAKNQSASHACCPYVLVCLVYHIDLTLMCVPFRYLCIDFLIFCLHPSTREVYNIKSQELGFYVGFQGVT